MKFELENKADIINVASLCERPDKPADHKARATASAVAFRQGDAGAHVTILSDEGNGLTGCW